MALLKNDVNFCESAIVTSVAAFKLYINPKSAKFQC